MSTVSTHVIHEITPLSDKDCFYIAERYKTEFTYPIHRHKEYELNFIERAAGVRRIVGDSVEIIGEYDLVLITGQELEHVWEQHECSSSREIREITIQFSPDLFFKNFINKNQFSSIQNMLENAQKGLCFPMSAILRVYPLLDTLASEQQGFYAVIKFLTILHELSLCEEVRTLSSSSFVKIDIRSDSRRVQKIQEYINEHYKEEIRLNVLAGMVGMTPVSFSRFFKVRTGKNLSEYIIDIRLGFSTRLLIDSTMSISEICYECGFNNLSYFNRVFKRKKLCSPREFRENYHKKKVLI
jgi:AraC-like DNA-binding protein